MDISEAIERRSASHGDERAVLGAGRLPDRGRARRRGRAWRACNQERRSFVASALAYVVDELADLRLSDAFSADEIVAAALEYLLSVGTPGWEEAPVANGLRHGHWAWSALFLHQPGVLRLEISRMSSAGL